MGYALACAARDRGAETVLVSGPVALAAPSGMGVIRVGTARQMLEAVQSTLTPNCTLIMAAAVADYAPARPASQKLKRSADDLMLNLTPNPDILLTLSRPSGMRVVAFAAETEGLLQHGAAKLARKGADLLVANDVSEPGAGFESDTNHVWLIRPHRPPVEIPRADKRVVADAILDALFTPPDVAR
jgi:phosphopantothenoylcysteine decarboxylase/phosphopantothenate--cysteine ligase